jgi:hypothetical protein
VTDRVREAFPIFQEKSVSTDTEYRGLILGKCSADKKTK